MFKGSYQRKLLTVFYSGGSHPLDIWDIQVKNGWTRRVKDEDIGTIVFEIAGTNVATAYIVSPPDPRGSLGITLPFITLFIKNLKRYFTFEIQILDDKQMRRRFRFSNYQSSTKVRPFACSVPLALKPAWNQMQLNLANFTMRAYGTNYMETQRVQIHANCRIRRIYFSDRLYTEEELPKDYRIHLNIRQAHKQLDPAPQETYAKEGAAHPSQSSILKKPSKAGEITVPPTSLETLVTETSAKGMPSVTDDKTSKSIPVVSSETTKGKTEHSGMLSERKITSKEDLVQMPAVPSMSSIKSQRSIDLVKSVKFEEDSHEIEDMKGSKEELGLPEEQQSTEVKEEPIEVEKIESPITEETESPRTEETETPRTEETESPRTEESESPRTEDTESPTTEEPLQSESEPAPESGTEDVLEVAAEE